jgi:glycosyltransferase involved in cell wall biosynthesis
LLFGSAQALRVIYQVFRSMRVHHPDVLHLNTSGSFGSVRDVIILYFARMLKVRTVAHYHLQKPPAEITSRLSWKLLRWGMSLADAVVLLDKRSEAFVRAALPDKSIFVLPTMVEIDVIEELRQKKESPEAESNPVAKLLFVGFISVVKGVRELVEACLQLSDLRFEVDLIGRVGDPSLQREVESLIQQAGKADQFHFHGGVDHATALEYMLEADLLVLPSHAESAPAVVIEAMGCGKPVVSTTTGAVPEMLDIGGPEECGVCVPPKNAEALAGAIRRLLNDPEECRRWGEVARKRAVERYSVPVGCAQLLAVWESMIPAGKLFKGESNGV